MKNPKQLRASVKHCRRIGSKTKHCRCTKPCQQTLPKLTPDQKAVLLGEHYGMGRERIKALFNDQPPYTREQLMAPGYGPGKGYRLLTRGEVIRPGDEWNHPLKGWMPVTVYGRTAYHRPERFRRKLETKPFFGQFLIVNREGTKWSLNTLQEVQAALWGRDMAQHDVWVRVDNLPADVGAAAMRLGLVQGVAELLPLSRGSIIIES